MVCCQKGTLGKVLGLLCLVQLATSLVCLALGCVLAGDSLVEQGMGGGVARVGRLLSLTAVCNVVGAAGGRYGARTHNKACLIFFIVAQLSSSLLSIVVVSAALSSAAYDVDEGTQLACAGAGINASCAAFLVDESRQALRALWKQMVWSSMDPRSGGPRMLQHLQNIQTAGSCCGFDPPFSCQYGPPAAEPVPSQRGDAFLAGTDAAPKGCGFEQQWFWPQMNCDVKVDNQTAGTVYRPGCPYFMPGANCVGYGYSIGCVFQLRLFLLARFVPLLQVARGIMWFNVVTVGVAFFYFIKRKASDVVPTAYSLRDPHRAFVAK
jgi:hypothetical protein